MTQWGGSKPGWPSRVTQTGFHTATTLPKVAPNLNLPLAIGESFKGRGDWITLSKMWKVRKSALHPGPSTSRRFCWTQANLWFGAFCISALQSEVTLISVVCICTGKAKYFYYLFYYLLYELLLFTWRFCLLLQVWNYLLLLGICALFKKQALFF